MSDDTRRCVAITTTLDDEHAARALAAHLVEQRLAACVQCAPVFSTYRWKGAVATAAEFRLTAKTRADAAARVMRCIRARHTYELPEIVVTPILDGLPEYLDWIAAQVAEDPPA